MGHKKIIFFDGDGTLWFPKKTKHTIKPHWVYKDSSIKNPLEHLVLVPGALKTLQELQKRKILCVVLSTHPTSLANAQKVLEKKVSYFKLQKYFIEIYATEEYLESKGEHISSILSKYKMPKASALMVGDNYSWDYKPAKKVGVEAVLIESDYMKKDKRLTTVRNIENILDFCNPRASNSE